MADGCGFGGEGDWKTSALLAAVKAMGSGSDRGT
jgi:L-arabinose isomerase